MSLPANITPLTILLGRTAQIHHHHHKTPVAYCPSYKPSYEEFDMEEVLDEPEHGPKFINPWLREVVVLSWRMTLNMVRTSEFFFGERVQRQKFVFPESIGSFARWNANILKGSGINFSNGGRSMWIARNEIVFEIKVMTMEALIFQSKMRAILWIRDVYDELMVQESFWWIFPNKCRFDTIKTRSSSSIWHPSPQGCLKFNICGIANDEVAGCGGVPRDMEGVARALFSGPITANDADSIEVGAMFIALDLFLSMRWKINGSLIVEIGSKMVYNWCLNKDMRPWLLQITFSNIERKIKQVGSVVFSMAD
ncbi:hypothetical protein CXB51_025172 [Gossypium anomalum]|uniref:RNase H type-1 domain-containing protein n=1 Tax=Gossypium anomalum TaxID=47600 RepID=A0A8J6CM41_9ROSI|nr:hypothetical protein CXB51_025172 [Gossypium anomalum]